MSKMKTSKSGKPQINEKVFQVNQKQLTNSTLKINNIEVETPLLLTYIDSDSMRKIELDERDRNYLINDGKYRISVLGSTRKPEIEEPILDEDVAIDIALEAIEKQFKELKKLKDDLDKLEKMLVNNKKSIEDREFQKSKGTLSDLAHEEDEKTTVRAHIHIAEEN